MLTFPQYTGDRFADPAPEDRARLYRPVAVAISAVAKNRTEAAALVALAYAETRLARYVLDGYCAQGPVGARCDGGRARGAWQNWSHCKALWAVPENHPSRHIEGARCAIRLLRAGRQQCGDLAGAFGVYAGAGCKWKGGKARAKTTLAVEGRLRGGR
jgi:hypothetical protein